MAIEIVDEEERADTLQVPKEFHIQERDRAYDDWGTAFWREYVQNSVDAGAKLINITIGTGTPKGFLDRDPTTKKITRVVFEDDGSGMSENVIRKVYFSAGASTKRGQDAVGGFGRARILQAFSQVRYSIRTQNLLVEGDGGDYKAYRVEEAADRLSRWAERQYDRAVRAADADEAAFLNAAAAARQQDAQSLKAEIAEGRSFVKGARFEVDLDPEEGRSHSRRPSIAMMEEKLEEYLAQCDLRCRIVVNGVERQKAVRKREARRDIHATLDADQIPDDWTNNPKVKILDRPDGRKDVAFGRIVVSDEKGKDIVVRVNGAAMFKRTAWDAPRSLLIELDPALAREVMTSNRDGLKTPYQAAVDNFMRLLSTDARAALEKKDEKSFTVLSGGKGRRVARRPQMDFSDTTSVTAALSRAGYDDGGADGLARPKKRTSVNYQSYDFSEFLKDGIGGVPHGDFASFFEALRKADNIESSFLNGWTDPSQASNFLTTLQRNGESAALEIASGELLAFLCEELRGRRVLADMEESKKHASKLDGLHDIPILKTDLRPDPDHHGAVVAKERRTKLLSAISRMDPRNWDPESGKGMRPRKILAAWQVAVDHCVELLMQTQPSLKPFDYSAGWCFSHPKWEWQPHSDDMGWGNAAAKFSRPDTQSESRYFLLNPLKDEDFTLRHNPSDHASRAEILSLALHEVAHVVSPDSHNERFAGAMTFMMAKMTPAWLRQVNRSMDAAIAAVDAVYAGARTKVQALDDQPGPRPGAVLLDSLPFDVVESLGMRAPDGTSELDCERVDMLESAYGMAADGPEPEFAPAPSF